MAVHISDTGGMAFPALMNQNTTGCTIPMIPIIFFFTEKFKTYPGKQMHKKKNLLNQFLRNYNVVSMPN